MNLVHLRYLGVRSYYKLPRPIQSILEVFYAFILKPIQKRFPCLDPDASKQK